MNVDRLSVTVPAEVGLELRRVAEARGEPVSMIVAEAISRELRLLALNDALQLAEETFGPVPEAAVEQAARKLSKQKRSA